MMFEWFLMRFKFNIRTKKSDLLSRLSWRLYDLSPLSLINYQGKVIFVVQTYPYSTTFDLWVMEDNVEWSRIHVDIPWNGGWKSRIDIIGTIPTGQFVFFYNDSDYRISISRTQNKNSNSNSLIALENSFNN